jgi:DNA-directed RNA polymerase subunit M/transcription elongation factor TFIIS
MEALDPAAEWLRLCERYRQMSDGELLALARQNSELTEVAEQTLASEIFRRGLKLQPEEPPASPNPVPQSDACDQDRELVEICTVWSLSDALQLQTLLDRGGIPFFMGPEKATGVDAVTSSFVNGVAVQIMRIGLPWAHPILKNYTPANEPAPKPEQELVDLPMCCPECHSTEIIFERLTSESAPAADQPSQYEWSCDLCGHQWEDDGTVKEE